MNEQLANAQGDVMQDVDMNEDNIVVSVKLMAGGEVLHDQLGGITTKSIEDGKAVFSDLTLPALTGRRFYLHFTLEDPDIDALLTEEFVVRPAHLLLNNSNPHSMSGMAMPPLSVIILNQFGRFEPQTRLTDASATIEMSVDLLTLRYLGCSRDRPAGMTNVNASECARRAAVAGAAYFYVSPDASSLCGFEGGARSCADSTCWHNLSLEIPPGQASICATAGCARMPKQEDGSECNASYGFRFFALQNSSASLGGQRRSRTLGGQATFHDLRIPNMYGKFACMLIFSDDVEEPSRRLLVATNLFDLDPVKIVFVGPVVPKLQFGRASFSNLTVSLADINGVPLKPLAMLNKYTLVATFKHHEADVPASDHVQGLTEMVVDSTGQASFALELKNVAGRAFAISFSNKDPDSLISPTMTSSFSVWPTSLRVDSTEIGGEESSPLTPVTVSCRDEGGLLLSGIRSIDDLKMEVAIYRNSTRLPSCSAGSTGSCVQGTMMKTVIAGLVTFTDLTVVGLVGSQFHYRFWLEDPLLPATINLDSAAFVVYPGALVITGGQIEFSDLQWQINNPTGGVYSVRLELKADASQVQGIQEISGFNLTARLMKGDRDFSAFLAGERLRQVAFNASHGLYASFTDLEITAASAGLRLTFSFADSSVPSSVTASTKTFDAVPHALRVQEKCYNGNEMQQTGSVDYGFRGLSCLGNGSTLSTELGEFGFLTGYYYYRNNKYFGPLLRNVRGRARVPPISVVATDLYAQTQRTIEADDGYRIMVQLFVKELDRTAYLSGATSALIVNGTSTFDDLVIEAFADCETSPCEIVLRFGFEGVLCTDIWCANITMEVRPVEVVDPIQLGSHPLFSSKTYVDGTMVLAGVPQSDFDNAETQQLFKEAVISAANVAHHTADDVEILEVDNVTTSTRRLLEADGLKVKFRITARSYAASTAMISSVTEVLNKPVAFTSLRECSVAEQELAICSSTVDVQEPPSRQVKPGTLADRAPAPRFVPAGTKRASCIKNQVCVRANISAFSAWSLLVDASPGQVTVFSTDACPQPTNFCSILGTALSPASRNTTSSGVIEVIGVSPTTTMIPVGLRSIDDNNPDPRDPQGYMLNIGKLQRQIATMPRYLTARARTYTSGNQGGFPVANTYALPPQAQTPYLEKSLRNRQFAPGFCNGTWIIYQSSRLEASGPTSQAGTCWDLHRLAQKDDESVCNSAVAVPCVTPRDHWICTAGSSSSTISTRGVYDGSVLRLDDAASTWLLQEYIPGQTSIKVHNLSSIGFTNNGPLLRKRKLFVGNNGQANTPYPPLVAVAVDQELSLLTVEPESKATSCPTGAEVFLADVCNISNVTSTVTANFRTDSIGVRMFYTLDGSEPSNVSLSIPSTGSISFQPPAQVRAVAAGDGFINSFAMDVEFKGACAACSAGQYNQAGADFQKCIDCPETRTSWWGSCSVAECQCAPGYEEDVSWLQNPDYMDPHMLCSACTANHYKELMGPSKCLPCAVFASSLPASSTASACTCNAGYEGVGRTSCVPCRAGFYKPSAGDSACLECGMGNFTNSLRAATSCDVCPEGTYSDLKAAITCKTCPPSMTSAPGSAELSDCQCTYGQTCLGCPAGQYGPSSPHVVASLGGNGGGTFQPNDINMDYPLPGNLAVLANYGNGRVMYVNVSTGEVTEVNSGGHGYADGEADVAEFYYPNGVAASPDSSMILVAGNNDHRVRKIDWSSRVVTTLSGDGTPGSRDGNFSFARFEYPRSIAFDPKGTRAYVSELGNRIRLLDFGSKEVSTIYTGGVTKITVTKDGKMLLFTAGSQVRAMDLSSYSVRTVAGSTSQGFQDGKGDSARFKNLQAITVDSAGRTAFVTDTGNHRIRAIDLATGRVATLAGSSSSGYEDGYGTSASFQGLQGLSITPDGSMLVVADEGNNR